MNNTEKIIEHEISASTGRKTVEAGEMEGDDGKNVEREDKWDEHNGGETNTFLHKPRKATTWIGIKTV